MARSWLLLFLGIIPIVRTEPLNSTALDSPRLSFRERRLENLHCKGKQSQVAMCNKAECPPSTHADCVWQDWNEWHRCTCNGVRERHRRVKTAAQEGGEGCKGPSMQVEPCETHCGKQPRDCILSEWESWSRCSNSCGGGQQIRHRRFLSQAANTGQPCEGTLSEVQECELNPCVNANHDCVWGQWSLLSECSKTCGGGQKTRHRKIEQLPQGTGMLCSPEDSFEIIACGTGACKATFDCEFSEWDEWSTCLGDCGRGGFQQRKRKIKQRAMNGGLGCSGKIMDHRPCDTVKDCPSTKADCAFSDWSSYSWCSSMCNGNKHRTRSVEVHARNGGKACTGTLEEMVPCNLDAVGCEGVGDDCRFSDWTDWEIPVFPAGKCRNGQSTRQRHIVHKPKAGGKPCQGAIREIQNYVAECAEKVDCQYEDWSDWSTCTNHCGGGQQSRGRDVAQANTLLGKPCEAGSGLETRACNTQECVPPVCSWGDWSDWELPGGSPCGRVQVERTRSKMLFDKATGKAILDTGHSDAVRGCIGTQHEVTSKDLARCTDDCKPRDCTVSAWTVWSPCGCIGLRARRRSIDEYPLCGGKPCDATLAEEESCPIERACKGFITSRPCEFSTWTTWSDCSTSCGYGKSVRYRAITHQALGKAPECVLAKTEETKVCTKGPCQKPVDCRYGDWSFWGKCSKSCDAGERKRERNIMSEAKFGGALCTASNRTEVEPCNTETCKGVNCKFSKWGPWSTCSLSCGGGVRSSSRRVSVPSTHLGKPCAGDLQRYEACNTQPCGDGPIDCRLSLWSPWSQCSSDCNGHRSRTRAVAQIARNGGRLCQGALSEVLPCNTPAPAVGEQQLQQLPGVGMGLEPCSTQNRDCKFSAWESWSSCHLIESVTCGNGQKRRSRSILQDSRGMGSPCIGELTDLLPCEVPCPDPIDCRWGEWGRFSDCTAPCSGGEKTRNRAVAIEAFGGGSPCERAAATEIEACNTAPCIDPAVCGWSQWSEWSTPEGNLDCGLSQVTRSRHRAIVDGKTLRPVNPHLVEGKMHAHLLSELESRCNGAQRQREVAAVDVGPCADCMPQDCKWSVWSMWSSCSCTGLTVRHRVIARYPKCGGKLCDGAEEESEQCESTCIQAPDRMCEYTEWTEWSGCTKECVELTGLTGGEQHQLRAVTQLSSGKFADFKCSDTKKTRKCGRKKCPYPRDCIYSSWDNWGACSLKCGRSGVRMRKRQVAQEPANGGKLCDAKALEEVAPCEECPVTKCELDGSCEDMSVDCRLSQWSRWGACSKECDGGYQMRQREIEQQPDRGGKPCGYETGEEELLLQEVSACNVQPCKKKVDCLFGYWGEWSQCSAGCNGRRSRIRQAVVDATNGGALCSGPLEQIEPCNAGPGVCGAGEDVDCRLGPWQGWSECSRSCDGGQRSRQRRVIQEPQYKGKPCEGILKEYGTCNIARCSLEINCQWGEWTQWSACTRPCGGGQREKYRSIFVEPKHGGSACAAQDSHVVDECNTFPCAEPTCIWEDWSAWKVPKAKCGTVTKTRIRKRVLEHKWMAVDSGTCHGAQTEMAAADLGPCNDCKRQNCVFGQWSKWSACPCDGFRTRHRIVKHFPRCGGEPCDDSTEQGEPCEPVCKYIGQDRFIHLKGLCKYSSWTHWSDCDVTCGEGKRYRLRSVTQESDFHACTEPSRQEQTCAELPCPQSVDCGYTDWSPWGECSETCDGGVQVRMRRISQAPQNDGAPCEAQALKELKSCNVGLCQEPIDCVLSEWGSWGMCSVTCGGGMKRRTRYVKEAPQGRGKPCMGEMQQFKDCGKGPCGEHVDCKFYPWEPWSKCSSPCNGIQHRFREIASISQGGGKPCTGAQREVRWPCHLQSVLCDHPHAAEPQDAVVEDWNPWSPCSATCDGGQRTRLRHVLTEATNGGKPATASLKEVEACGMKPCIVVRDCVWGVWEDWASCDRECDGGQQSRTRSIAVEPAGGGAVCQAQAASEVRQCNTEPCKPKGHTCIWGHWEHWTLCDDPCNGQQKRFRRVLGQGSEDQTAELGAKIHDPACAYLAPMQETRACSHNCQRNKCINARWGRWSDWSECSCHGLQERSRKVIAFANHCGRPLHGPMKQTRMCYATCIKSIDCWFMPWGLWSGCSQTCEGGQRYRSRKIGHKAVGPGKPCDGALTQAEACGNVPCHRSALDCKWGDWKAWSACSSECGSGEMTRTRSIVHPHKKGGLPCDAHANVESAPCNNGECGGEPSDCKWHPWTDWGRCSASCDGGLHFRTRGRIVEKYGGQPCEGRVEDFDTCADVPCVKKDAEFTLWSDWSACSDPCGGHQERTRSFAKWAAEGGKPLEGALTELRPCKVDLSEIKNPEEICPWTPVDCVLSEWIEWGKCDRECGGGQRYRSRHVITPGSHGGKGCSDSLSDAGSCNTQDCPDQLSVDCEWSEWEKWSECTRDCGGGQQQRRKHIMVEPLNGGEPCTGDTSVEVRGCNLDPCGVKEYCTWAEWTTFGDCSTSCGPGEKRRVRNLVMTHTKPLEGFFSADMFSEGLLRSPVQGTLDMLSMVGFACSLAGLIVVSTRAYRAFERNLAIQQESTYSELSMTGPPRTEPASVLSRTSHPRASDTFPLE